MKFNFRVTQLPESEDPVIQPSKLFRIERIKPIKNTTKLQRRILDLFKLSTDGQVVSIAKNIPENNAALWKIKHLIRVTPITFPYGEPTLNDLNHTILKENGQCIVKKELKIDENRIEAWDNFKENPGKMDGGTVVKYSRLKWMNAWAGGF